MININLIHQITTDIMWSGIQHGDTYVCKNPDINLAIVDACRMLNNSETAIEVSLSGEGWAFTVDRNGMISGMVDYFE